MEFAEYKNCLEAIPYGKRLPSALYVFRAEGCGFGCHLDSLIHDLTIRFEIPGTFNVVKFRTEELKISFLS